MVELARASIVLGDESLNLQKEPLDEESSSLLAFAVSTNAPISIYDFKKHFPKLHDNIISIRIDELVSRGSLVVCDSSSKRTPKFKCPDV